MTKKDYEAIARIMREAKDLPNKEATRKFILLSLGSVFEMENTRFDYNRFVEACT